MRIVFQEYRFRMYLWAFLGVILLAGLLSFGWYQSVDVKKNRDMDLIGPLTGEVMGETLRRVEGILQSYYIDSLHGERDAMQASQDIFNWYYKGRMHTRFLPADIEGVRSLIDGLYSEAAVPQYASNYLLRFSDKDVTQRLFMVRNAFQPLLTSVIIST